MSNFLIRKGTVEDYPQLVEFIDQVFFPDGSNNFRDFLPNLYCDPQVATRQAYLAFEGAKIIGHVGVYPLRLKIAKGVELSAGGVGAVATHADCRHKGSMTMLLNAAIAGMQEACYDISVLWGNRMRYSRFGWELAGRKLQWKFDLRFARANRIAPLALTAFDPSRHLNLLLEAWNSDICGTIHDFASISGMMRRRQWTTHLLATWHGAGPTPFVTWQRSGNQIIVDKLVGPPELLPGMLLKLCEEELNPDTGHLVVRCPTLDHPIARLALQAGDSEWSQWPTCQARIVDPRSTAEKLGVATDTLTGPDRNAIIRSLFGTPADHHEAFPIWVEEPAYL